MRRRGLGLVAGAVPWGYVLGGHRLGDDELDDIVDASDTSAGAVWMTLGEPLALVTAQGRP